MLSYHVFLTFSEFESVDEILIGETLFKQLSDYSVLSYCKTL